MKKPALILGVIAVVILAGLGIAWRVASGFVARRAAEAGTEAAVKLAAGGNVDVDTSSDTLSVRTTDGSASFSSNGTLPSGFPADIPTPSFGTITSSYSGTGSGSSGYNVAYSLTSAQAKTASTTYEDQLKAAGYSVEGTATSTSGGTTLDIFSAKKGDKTVAVSVSTAEDGSATLNLTVSIDAAN